MARLRGTSRAHLSGQKALPITCSLDSLRSDSLLLADVLHSAPTAALDGDRSAIGSTNFEMIARSASLTLSTLAVMSLRISTTNAHVASADGDAHRVDQRLAELLEAFDLLRVRQTCEQPIHPDPQAQRSLLVSMPLAPLRKAL